MQKLGQSSVPLTRIGFSANEYNVHPKNSMKEFLRRDEVALHILSKGRLRVLFAGGRILTLEPKRLMVSWGAFPHRAIWLEPNNALFDVTIPLGWFMEWDLPRPLIERLMQGEFLIGPAGAEGERDLDCMHRWVNELFKREAEWNRIVLMEIQARLRRMAIALPRTNKRKIPSPSHLKASVGRVLQAMTANISKPLRIRDLAKLARVHPAYLSQAFKQELGIGPAAYLAQYRIAYAQSLLLESALKIPDIVEKSGFGSICQFHAVFRRESGCTPRQYREKYGSRMPSP